MGNESAGKSLRREGMIEAARKDGKIYFYDPQNEKRKPERFFTTYTRIDTLKVTDLILKCCTNQ